MDPRSASDGRGSDTRPSLAASHGRRDRYDIEVTDAPSTESPTQPPRVVFCITELDDGGAERALVQIATRLAAGGKGWSPHEVAVVCLGPEAPLAVPLRDAGLRVTCLGWSKRWHFRRRQLRAAILVHQPDVVVSFLFHANVATRFARLNLPIIASHRVAERGATWHLWLERRTAHRAAHHVAVSDGVAKRLSTAGICSPSTIPNGVDFDRFASALPDSSPWEPGTFRLLAAGRLHEQKGFRELIDALPETGECPDLHLVIAGEGPLREELLEQIDKRTAGSRHRVSLLGRVDDLAPLYRAADLFVLSSRWEGMPNVLLEAAAAGCPILAADVEGVREVVGDDAVVVPAHWDRPTVAADVSATLTQLAKTRRMPDGRTISEAAELLQLIVQKEFTWDATARSYAELIASVGPRGR